MKSLGLNANKGGCYYSVYSSSEGLVDYGYIETTPITQSPELRKLLQDSAGVMMVASHFSSYRGQPKRIAAAANNGAAIAFLCKDLDVDYDTVDDNYMYRTAGSDYTMFPEIMHEVYGVPTDLPRGLLLAIFASIIGRQDED